MYDTLVTATRVAQRGLANVTLAQLEPTPRPMIVFLTDGEPTVGQLDPERILAVTRRHVRGLMPENTYTHTFYYYYIIQSTHDNSDFG